MLTKPLFIVCEKTFPRICYIDCAATLSMLSDFIYDNKVILIPMSYAWKWSFRRKCFNGNSPPNCFETDLFCRLANSK